ncbi:MAG: very short patch repair endonuclease [Caulobacterales bacterium 32-69-10]|nr:MAG: very short patch repair endonuclease [Caulobacterales bacterium 32-69-10]
MGDKITPEQRSAVMRRIRSKDTAPELAVRRLLHRMGYRFRLHAGDLKGKPDVVFRRRRAVIFVHGCYWHGHDCRVAGKPAQSNTGYWGPKIQRTRERDESTRAALEAAGWRVLIIRECEGADLEATALRLREFLGPPKES